MSVEDFNNYIFVFILAIEGWAFWQTGRENYWTTSWANEVWNDSCRTIGCEALLML